MEEVKLTDSRLWGYRTYWDRAFATIAFRSGSSLISAFWVHGVSRSAEWISRDNTNKGAIVQLVFVGSKIILLVPINCIDQPKISCCLNLLHNKIFLCWFDWQAPTVFEHVNQPQNNFNTYSTVIYIIYQYCYSNHYYYNDWSHYCCCCCCYYSHCWEEARSFQRSLALHRPYSRVHDSFLRYSVHECQSVGVSVGDNNTIPRRYWPWMFPLKYWDCLMGKKEEEKKKQEEEVWICDEERGKGKHSKGQ